MSRAYKITDQTKSYFVSFAVVGWIDVFVRIQYKNAIVDSLKYCQEKKGLVLYAWCIMTSHVHLIMGTDDKPMENIIRDIKRHTSKVLLSDIENNAQESRKEWMMKAFAWHGKHNPNNETYQFWQQNNQPIELKTPEMFTQRLNYTHDNPVEAGFVDAPEDYLFSSARDYAGRQGLINVEVAFMGV